MEKEIPGRWALFARHTLSTPMDIGDHASRDEPILRALASKNGLEVAGPLEHAYWDMAIKGAPHILEIWLPVLVKSEGQVMAELKHIESYNCLSSDFRRPIEEIGDAWMELVEKARKLGYQLTNHDREVYKTMDCDHPELNEIELQLGIK